MVERQLPKLYTRVRFPSPAPSSTKLLQVYAHLQSAYNRTGLIIQLYDNFINFRSSVNVWELKGYHHIIPAEKFWIPARLQGSRR